MCIISRVWDKEISESRSTGLEPMASQSPGGCHGETHSVCARPFTRLIYVIR